MPSLCVNYRYGFNGMEKDDEVKGKGNSYTTEFRQLDPRLGGRWWSIDPIVKPWESPYAGFGNNPILFSDPSGLDKESATKKEEDKGLKDGEGTQYSKDGNERTIGSESQQTLDPRCDC